MPISRVVAKPRKAAGTTPPTECVGDILQGYTTRGVFRGLQRVQVGPRRARFRIRWFQERQLDLTVDTTAARLALTSVLPGVDSKSTLYRDLRAWLERQQSGTLPAHRGLDPSRAVMRAYNRQGMLSLYLTSLDGDWEYATQRLVHLVNELYLDFLSDGRYYEWVVEAFGLDPDNPRWP